MGKHIQAMSDHGLKLLLVCLVVLVSARVQGANVTILQSAVEKGAVCLNGSPPSYYLDRGSGEGADNWALFLQGGAWCMNETHCIFRAIHDTHGGSENVSRTSFAFSGLFSPNETSNPDFYNWNKVFINYCDLASYTGDVEEVDPKNNLHYRGSKVFDAIIEDVMEKGMKNAKNAILSGQSAGGLGAMLHCDQLRELLPNANRVKCLSDGGYFIRGKDLPIPEPILEEPYLDIVALHGMAKYLPKSCTSKMDAKLCLYPENFVDDMKTPVFLVNSAFDSFQIKQKVMLAHVGWEQCRDNPTTCSPDQLQAIRDLRKSFINALPKSSSVGMFINSCYIHDHILADGRWSGTAIPALKNKTMAQAFHDWYFDRSAFQEIDPNDTPVLNVPYL